MKKILIAALIFAAGIGTTYAQDNNDKQQCPENCTEAQNGPRDGKPAFNPFEGLNLTADQQAKLEALKAEGKAEGQKAKEERKADRQRERKDKAQAGKAARAEMLAKIKDILTPEQYLQFLENSYLNAPAPNRDPRFGKGQRPGQPGKDVKEARGVRR